VLVDAHRVPRVRGYSGNPVTAPIALAGAPKTVGTPWPGYRPGALAAVHPSTVTITNFVLVDVVTGQPFNRPAATTGTNDTPHTQAVPPPQPAPTTPPQGPQPTTRQAPQLDIDGTYLQHDLTNSCQGLSSVTVTITHQGNTVTFALPRLTYTGTLNPDGSFTVSSDRGGTMRGVFTATGAAAGIQIAANATVTIPTTGAEPLSLRLCQPILMAAIETACDGQRDPGIVAHWG
jgi:hypothetical protein